MPAVQGAEAVQGVILHEVLRRAGEARRAGDTVSAPLLGSLHAQVWTETAFPDPRRAPAFKRAGLAQLEAFRAGGGFELAPYAVEREFTAGVDGFTLHGVIDRVDRTDSGWRIIDYKTGRPLGRARRDLQVALYGLGATVALGVEAPALEVVYLASGQHVEIDGAESLQEEAKRVGSETSAAIRAGQFDSEPERRKCRLCAYRLACVDAL